jgi:hypothetical protein
MLLAILVVVLILALAGSVPAWPYSRDWGYYPSGGVGLVLLVLLILFLMGGSDYDHRPVTIERGVCGGAVWPACAAAQRSVQQAPRRAPGESSRRDLQPPYGRIRALC